MASTQRPRVFLDVSIGEEPAGRLTIELFVDKTPRTCENFRQLCTGEHDGLSYAQAPLHRIIDEFMVQGGDIEKGDGTGTVSIYDGEEFEDENLNWRAMDAAGLLCSANRGKDTNGSQFFFTLEPCHHLNGKHTIFGRLVSGNDTLQKIAKVEVDDTDRPLEPVLVSRCGELEKRKKTAPPPKDVPSSISRDRGRRRKSDNSDVEMENSPEPRPVHKHRRQSDNVIDEGIRGRPRQRSVSQSQSRPDSGQDQDDSSDHSSPNRKHKRKRSPSPSRNADTGGHERRRRSLPNQYADDQYRRRYDDEERYKPSPRRDNYRSSDRRREDAAQRHDDRYRPSRDRVPRGEDGRLAGSGQDGEPPVKFKGRGVMKYREPDRAW